MSNNKIRAAAAALGAAIAVCGLSLPGVASAANAPITCSIQTVDGHYLTAVGGGNRISDVIHTDATVIRAWERFTLVDPGDGVPIFYGIKTYDGHWLTAVGGGGLATNPLHSDATQKLAWEKFQFVSAGNDQWAIKTNTGK